MVVAREDLSLAESALGMTTYGRRPLSRSWPDCRNTRRARPVSRSETPLPLRTHRDATHRNGTSSSPPGRQITNSTRSGSSVGAGGLVMSPDELRRRERDRLVGIGVAQQLPRHTRHFRRVGVDLHPHPGQLIVGLRPQLDGPALDEHPLEQLPPNRREQLLRAARERRGRIGGELGVVLQVPAHLLLRFPGELQ